MFSNTQQLDSFPGNSMTAWSEKENMYAYQKKKACMLTGSIAY